jgi:hypothetical protein
VLDLSTALNGAGSYNLLVEVKKTTRFANSNIIWDGSKLTFATNPGENGAIPANVQGAFFRWGSLVAISPTGTYTAAQYPSGSILYSPTGTYNYAFASIPYTDETTGIFGDIDASADDFASYNGTGYNASAGKGDICRYITSQGWVSGGSWRLPKGLEFQALVEEQTPSYSGAWTEITSYSSLSTGSNQLTSYALLGTGATLIFPASGSLEIKDIAIHGIGYYFACPSSSSNGSTANLGMGRLSGAPLTVQGGGDRRVASSVRCIRAN